MSTLDNLQIFQDEVYTQTSELVANQVELFNQASNGCIVLQTNMANQGDFSKEAYYKKISNLVRRRDPYDRTSTVSEVTIEHLLKVAVKVAAGTPPVSIDPDTLAWIQRNPTEYATVIADQLAGDMLEDMLGTALVGFIAATRNAGKKGGVAGLGDPLLKDVSNGADTGTASLTNLLSTARKFGDRAGAIKCWVIHSGPMHDIFAETLANSNRLFEFGNVQVMEDGFGRRFVVTDDAALVNSGSPDGYNTCGVVQGGIMVQQNNDFLQSIVDEHGKENIHRTYQAEWSYNVGIKGYQWDTSTKAPTDAELATEGNWDRIATDVKDCAGVLMVSD